MGKLWRSAVLAGAFLVLAAAASRPGSESPDIPADEIRDYLLDAFQRNREMDLAYLNAAPDSMLRWAPTSDVRDFAEQMAHTTHGFFQFWRDDYVYPDTTLILNDRESFRQELDEAYDWVTHRLERMSDGELVEVVEVAQGMRAPRWRVMMYWLDHAMWTRASVIPYLRLNGTAPPPVRFW